jgi:hypothetical protein
MKQSKDFLFEMTLEEFVDAVISGLGEMFKFPSAEICGLKQVSEKCSPENTEYRRGLTDAIEILERHIGHTEAATKERIQQKTATLRQGFEMLMASKIDGNN